MSQQLATAMQWNDAQDDEDRHVGMTPAELREAREE